MNQPAVADTAAANFAAPASPANHSVYFSDVQRVLALFAQGLSGHYLHLKPIASMAADAPDELRSGGITTDGGAIYLPEFVDGFDSARHNFGAYRIAVLHQLGFFENGTFLFSFDEARARIPSLPDALAQPTILAAGADSELARFFSLWPSPKLIRQLFVTLEDLRIDVAMRSRYPGARADLDRVLVQALEQRPDMRALNRVAALWEGLVQYTLGAPRESLQPMDRSGLLDSLLDAVAPLETGSASVYDSAQAAIACYRALELAGLPREESDQEPQLGAEDSPSPDASDNAGDGNGEGDSAALDESSIGATRVEFRGELIPEFVQCELYGGSTDSPPEGMQLTSDPQRPKDAPVRPPRPPNLKAAPPPGRTDEDGPRTFLYDEWDFHHQSYIKGWCRLYEYRLKGEDYNFIRDVRRRHAVLAHQVKRRFRFIKPESLRRTRRVSDGDELEIDGVIEAVIDRRAGHATDEYVYVRRDRALRDVSAAFLLDMSASTGYPIPDTNPPPPEPDTGEYPMHLYDSNDDPLKPAPPKRSVIDVAKESLALMCDALGTLGDSYAIYGFSGSGREKVEFHVAKEFEDRLSSATWTALAAMKPLNSTRMGPAIRHALTKLKRQPARMKVLIVVSDGYPQDHDYGPSRIDDEYGIQDTARALQEAKEQGVQAFCVTIDPSGHDYLQRMCDGNRYLVIDEVDDLPGELTKVYRTLTA